MKLKYIQRAIGTLLVIVPFILINQYPSQFESVADYILVLIFVLPGIVLTTSDNDFSNFIYKITEFRFKEDGYFKYFNPMFDANSKLTNYFQNTHIKAGILVFIIELEIIGLALLIYVGFFIAIIAGFLFIAYANSNGSIGGSSSPPPSTPKNRVTDNSPKPDPFKKEKRMIADCHETQGIVYVKDEIGNPLFAKQGTLIGYTSDTVTIADRSGVKYIYRADGSLVRVQPK